MCYSSNIISIFILIILPKYIYTVERYMLQIKCHQAGSFTTDEEVLCSRVEH